MSLEKILKIS